MTKWQNQAWVYQYHHCCWHHFLNVFIILIIVPSGQSELTLWWILYLYTTDHTHKEWMKCTKAAAPFELGWWQLRLLMGTWKVASMQSSILPTTTFYHASVLQLQSWLSYRCSMGLLLLFLWGCYCAHCSLIPPMVTQTFFPVFFFYLPSVPQFQDNWPRQTVTTQSLGVS